MELRINVVIFWAKTTVIFGVMYMPMDIASEIPNLAWVYWSV
jgi:hypothetical protein